MNNREHITGVVLAGGKSTRMGQDKALLTLNGKPFIKHVASALQAVFAEVIVSANSTDYEFLGLPVVKDVYENCGPLGGIHAALTAAKTESVFIASCDMPLLTPAVIRFIIEKPFNGDVLVASTRDYVQPLCGLYARSCLPTLESHLKGRTLSVSGFLCSLRSSCVDVDEHRSALVNINSEDDYSHLLGVFAAKTAG